MDDGYQGLDIGVWGTEDKENSERQKEQMQGIDCMSW